MSLDHLLFAVMSLIWGGTLASATLVASHVTPQMSDITAKSR